MNFQYTVDPYSDEPIMLVNKHVGFDQEDGQGIDGAAFQSELLALDMRKPKRIQVWINSPGGGVGEGFNMYSAVLLSNTPVDTVNLGMAASIAGVLFQAGRNRTMMDYSFLMYHNPHGGDNKKLLSVMKDSINKMTARSGKTEDEITAMMNKTTYINAQDALAYGMCDKIESSSDHNKKRMSQFTMAGAPSNSFWKEANVVLNSIFKIEDKKSMKQVANKLGLNAEASEDSIVAAVSGLQNKITAIENKSKADLEEMENKWKDAENKAKESKEAFDKLKAEKEASDKLAEEEKDKMLTEKCKNMVEGFAKVGKIKNEAKVITFWTELAKADFEIVKNQIESLPVNKTAPVIEFTSGEADKKVYTFAGQMGLIANKISTQK